MIDRSDVLTPFLPEPYLVPAWLDCLRWALGESGVMDAFRAETGCAWRPARTAIDRAVDLATGCEADSLRRFAAWFNANVWGPVGGEDES
jgi:hypothetical protein